MKIAMPDIAANESLKKRLCDNILSSKFSHAYIIEGKKGSGKHLLAKNIAKAISCKSKDLDSVPIPCSSCRSCTMIDADKSPDIITVSRDIDKASLGIDAARFIKNDVIVYPVELEHKIYIIEEADKMTDQAQNALLLTLEEPPSYAIFLLLCEQASLLLETVRSRAPIIRTESVPNGIIADFLCERSPYTEEATLLKANSPEEFEELIMASDGAIGMAYELLDPELRQKVLEGRSRIKSFINAITSTCSFDETLKALLAYSSAKRDVFSSELELTMVALRDIIALKKSEDAPLCFFSDREDALDISSKRPITYLLSVYSELEKAMDSVNRNANIRLVLTDLASNVCRK